MVNEIPSVREDASFDFAGRLFAEPSLKADARALCNIVKCAARQDLAGSFSRRAGGAMR